MNECITSALDLARLVVTLGEQRWPSTHLGSHLILRAIWPSALAGLSGLRCMGCIEEPRGHIGNHELRHVVLLVYPSTAVCRAGLGSRVGNDANRVEGCRCGERSQRRTGIGAFCGTSAGLSTTLQRGGSPFARWDAHQATQTLPGRPSVQASLLGTTPTNIPEQKREV